MREERSWVRVCKDSVLLLPLDGMLSIVCLQPIHLYSWVERGSVRVTCLSKNTTQWPRQSNTLTDSLTAVTIFVFLPSCIFYFFSVFIFPRMCFDSADARNHLVHHGDAPVGLRGCAQAQCSTSMGQPGEIRYKKTKENHSNKSLPANKKQK